MRRLHASMPISSLPATRLSPGFRSLIFARKYPGSDDSNSVARIQRHGEVVRIDAACAVHRHLAHLIREVKPEAQMVGAGKATMTGSFRFDQRCHDRGIARGIPDIVAHMLIAPPGIPAHRARRLTISADLGPCGDTGRRTGILWQVRQAMHLSYPPQRRAAAPATAASFRQPLHIAVFEGFKGIAAFFRFEMQIFIPAHGRSFGDGCRHVGYLFFL